MAWKEAKGDFPPFIDWEEMNPVEGKILSKKAIKVQGEPCNIMRIKTKDGEYTISESAGLRPLFALEDGTIVKITYEGKKKNPNTGRTFNAFKVEYEEHPAEDQEPPQEPF